jgi:hypothetical protein
VLDRDLQIRITRITGKRERDIEVIIMIMNNVIQVAWYLELAIFAVLSRLYVPS